MKNIFILTILFFILTCVDVNSKEKTVLQHVNTPTYMIKIICISGVEYLFITGTNYTLTPHYKADGTIHKCKEN